MKQLKFFVIFLIIRVIFFNGEIMSQSNKNDLATFGSGCFWCTEAIFEKVKGVTNVKSGYSGGTTENPTYNEVCTGSTGHAEVIQLTYNPSEISYDELLEIFWKSHDPTTLNRQGNDIGTQYRSVIFYHNDNQKARAEYWKEKLNKSEIFSTPIVTKIEKFKKFYIAEDYHQDYYMSNKSQPYCSFVITPKIKKFEKLFSEKMKK